VGRLFWKFLFAFWLALLVAVASVGATIWLYQLAPNIQNQELTCDPRNTALLVSAAVAAFRQGGRAALQSMLEEWRGQGGAQVYVVDDTGRDALDRQVPAEALAQAQRSAREERGPRIARLESVAQRQYLFFIPVECKATPYRPPPPLWFPISIIILASLVFSTLLAWYLSKPIRHLRGAFDAAAAGKLETRIGLHMGRWGDEISDLGRDFDHMAQQLQILLSSQRRLLHDVSHEIRSPLARLQAAIGLTRQQPEKPDAWLDRIEREAGRLDELVGELLTLSRLEVGMTSAADEEVDVVDLVAGIADDARFEAEATGRRVLFFGAGAIFVRVRPELLHRALENVIRNAVKYTREGTAAEVRIEQWAASNRLIVTVSDQGPGVPETDLQAIFEPFFRSEAYGKTVGFGLGLAIARRAIEMHGGTIRALNRDGGGLCVEMVLPTISSTYETILRTVSCSDNPVIT
jgi:two-component system, OmpR family, sensor kinase